MNIVKMKVSELRPNEKNIRRHNQNQIKELAKAIDSFGVIRPIVCDENGTILCGHGLWFALQEKGIDTADCVVVKDLSEKQKKKLMLADNKIYELASNDYDLIDSILQEFGDEGDFSIPGYSSETLEDLYGIRSVEKSAREIASQPLPQNDDLPRWQEESAPSPSARVQEERTQAIQQRRIIVCPHCGGSIEL